MARKGITASNSKSLRSDLETADSTLEVSMAHPNVDLIQFNSTNFFALFKTLPLMLY